MSTLHTFSALPDSEPYRDCVRLLGGGDALLLLGEGVYAALALPELEGVDVYLLASDAAGRGVIAPDRVARLDMAGFVALTERFPRQVAWY